MLVLWEKVDPMIRYAALLTFGAFAAGPAWAEDGCVGLAVSACVSQVGDRNLVETRIEGRGNGGGVIDPSVATGIKVLGSDGVAAADLVMQGLPGGVVRQAGSDNQAAVRIAGDGNQFHVSQTGDRNNAVQAVRGDGNAVAAEQGVGPLDGDNLAVQAQVGSGNVARVVQAGSGNIAVQAQVPTMEAALAAFGTADAGALDGAVGAVAAGTSDRNTILLEQNGDDNQAYLAQVGTDHQIALRQQGGAEITIMQFGAGQSIGIEQPAGQTGVQIFQY